MAAPQQLFDDYVQLRKGGLEATVVLQMLRAHIELLPAIDRATFVRQVKVWEAQQPVRDGAALPAFPAAPVSSVTPPPAKPKAAIPSIQPVTPLAPPLAPPPAPSVSPVSSVPPLPPKPGVVPVKAGAAAVKRVACPECGRPNPEDDVMCFSCGALLKTQSSPFATVPLSSGKNPLPDDSFFGARATLILQVRGSSQSFSIQPQREDHEMIVGRSDGSAMKPDVDLAPHNGGQFGVSRMHLSIQYNGKTNTVSVADLNSANGTFVNGQRLHSHEVRVLRHGDELRLGRMVFQVQFLQAP